MLSNEAVYFLIEKFFNKKEYQKCLNLLTEYEAKLKDDEGFDERKELYTMAVEKKYPFDLEDQSDGN